MAYRKFNEVNRNLPQVDSDEVAAKIVEAEFHRLGSNLKRRFFSKGKRGRYDNNKTIEALKKYLVLREDDQNGAERIGTEMRMSANWIKRIYSFYKKYVECVDKNLPCPSPDHWSDSSSEYGFDSSTSEEKDEEEDGSDSGDITCEVERILEKKKDRHGHTTYKVKWKLKPGQVEDWSDSENWVAKEDLQCPDLLAEFRELEQIKAATKRLEKQRMEKATSSSSRSSISGKRGRPIEFSESSETLSSDDDCVALPKGRNPEQRKKLKIRQRKLDELQEQRKRMKERRARYGEFEGHMGRSHSREDDDVLVVDEELSDRPMCSKDLSPSPPMFDRFEANTKKKHEKVAPVNEKSEERESRNKPNKHGAESSSSALSVVSTVSISCVGSKESIYQLPKLSKFAPPPPPFPSRKTPLLLGAKGRPNEPNGDLKSGKLSQEDRLQEIEEIIASSNGSGQSGEKVDDIEPLPKMKALSPDVVVLSSDTSEDESTSMNVKKNTPVNRDKFSKDSAVIVMDSSENSMVDGEDVLSDNGEDPVEDEESENLAEALLEKYNITEGSSSTEELAKLTEVLVVAKDPRDDEVKAVVSFEGKRHELVDINVVDKIPAGRVALEKYFRQNNPLLKYLASQ